MNTSLRMALFLMTVILTAVALFVGYQGVQTLRLLDVVEQERDQWQRPQDILAQLNVKDGSVIADIGAGAGYFSLKLALLAGQKGSVMAEDIRREPLLFLLIRSRLRGLTQVHTIHGEAADPQLPAGQVDGVLIANTYHEFSHPAAVLRHVFQALRKGGRLVIVDRGPPAATVELPAGEANHHHVAPAEVEKELRDTGFELLNRLDSFIDRPAPQRPGDLPDDHSWWLISARKR